MRILLTLSLCSAAFAQSGRPAPVSPIKWSGVDGVFRRRTASPGNPCPRIPGAADIQIRVRDIEPVFAAIKKVGATIITRSSAPIKIGPLDTNLQSILVRDPDGYMVEAIQFPPDVDTLATGNVIGAVTGLTIGDMESTLKFYIRTFSGLNRPVRTSSLTIPRLRI
jgi:hypothetical protein